MILAGQMWAPHVARAEDDFTEDLKKIDVPTLLLRGDADQIVPVDDASVLSAKIVGNAKLTIIPDAPDGLCSTIPDRVNEELLAFIRS